MTPATIALIGGFLIVWFAISILLALAISRIIRAADDHDNRTRGE